MSDNPFEMAKQRLLDDGWTKGSEADENGRRCVRGAIRGTRRVMRGERFLTADGREERRPVWCFAYDSPSTRSAEWVQFASDLLPSPYTGSLVAFNDRVACTFDEVMDFLDTCARAWKERERDTTDRDHL